MLKKDSTRGLISRSIRNLHSQLSLWKWTLLIPGKRFPVSFRCVSVWSTIVETSASQTQVFLYSQSVFSSFMLDFLPKRHFLTTWNASLRHLLKSSSLKVLNSVSFSGKMSLFHLFSKNTGFLSFLQYFKNSTPFLLALLLFLKQSSVS